MSYCKDECEYCKNQIVMTVDELNNPTFFGQPKIEKDQSMYKCPVCGHVNIRKNVDFTPCYQNGSTSIRFELSSEETTLVNAFKREHDHTSEHAGKFPPYLRSIQQFTYSLTSYGYGYHIMIKCNECGEYKEIC